MTFQALFSDDIDEKKKELNQLKKKIKENKMKAGETEKKKSKVISQKKEVIKKLNQSKKNHEILKSKEKKLMNRLTKTREEIKKTDENLVITGNLGSKVFVDLVKKEISQKELKHNQREVYVFLPIFQQSYQKFNGLITQKTKLIYDSKTTEYNVNSVRQMEDVEKSKAKNYGKMSDKLEGDIRKLEKEKQYYLDQARQIQKTAAAMESLIKKLTPKPEDRKEYSYKFSDGVLNWPLKGRIVRSYGLQNHTKYNIQTENNGIDIAATEGSVVHASANGKVVYAGSFSGSGQMVIIDHENGFHTVYAYNNSIIVNKGQTVKKGQTIAYSGKSTLTEEPSLHFEIRKNGKPINPLNYLK